MVVHNLIYIGSANHQLFIRGHNKGYWGGLFNGMDHITFRFAVYRWNYGYEKIQQQLIGWLFSWGGCWNVGALHSAILSVLWIRIRQNSVGFRM